MQGKARNIGPASRPHILAKLDQRTREARLLQAVRDDLTAHVGGAPSATQRQLIERAAWLTLHVAMLDARTAECGAISERDGRQYLAWSNSLSRTLRELGLKAAAAKPPSLADYIAAKRAAPALPEGVAP